MNQEEEIKAKLQAYSDDIKGMLEKMGTDIPGISEFFDPLTPNLDRLPSHAEAMEEFFGGMKRIEIVDQDHNIIFESKIDGMEVRTDKIGRTLGIKITPKE